MTLTVPPKWVPFIMPKMKSGRYRSEQELLDEALGLLKSRDSGRDTEVKRIEALMIEGLDSGPSTPMTTDDWNDVEREGKRLIAERKARKAR
jgi:putative addiction module CopG family antidote